MNFEDSKKPTDLKNLCRVCLTENKAMKSLNEKMIYDESITSIADVLSAITNSKINGNPQYPSCICPMCLGLLNLWYKFKLQFNKSQEVLTEYYGETMTYNNHIKKDCPAVELISPQGIFNLEDVLIVEDPENCVYNYDGFLNNLGSEVSASFVTVTSPVLDQKLVPSNKQVFIGETKSACRICKQLYKNHTLLSKHIKIAHYNRSQTFVCEICGAFLNTRSKFYHHMMKHNNKKFCCNVCNKHYYSFNHLQLHCKAVHLNQRPHLCTVCGRSFNYSNALIYHMRLHTEEQKYKCKYCNRRFTMSGGLKRHLASHTGIRDYQCSHCDRALKSKGELLCHEMTHTGRRPYHCKYCKKGFIKKYNMKLHLMNHKGPHGCEICSRTFIEIEYLKIHLERSHGCD